ncbi:TRAP transporter small permease [Pseudotabrizicola algicola]|uniref:TRAP transporter small permease protein n=1 Tax=Pseudotabrizicola algicola TaxID=2709381 RepID=A0A6B3RT71_9RHOB|nr:TRAP transporter small permease [Pseudotabrizicola algicola]NEX48721.1 TRAP transporter small permease [Pseudotabrizicola algicola]
MQFAHMIRRTVETVLVCLMSAMVALTFADVIGRRLFGTPIFGAHDLTEHLMGLLVFTGLPLVTLAAMHLKVDLFDKCLLHPRFAWWLKMTTLVTAMVFAVMAWTLLGKAMNAATFSEVSQGLNIPRAPLYGWMAACAALTALAALYTAFAPPISNAHDQEELL